ncbi:DUF2905 domain-containing protein [Dyadobacter psychrotolerans]|uniref:DUF2905 domain-containing protein n=1 Tax=Dyadobacter psychrotolerans TaxID=2541721 RepID=A0A4R5DYM2_9BACT|nr:DUF2905 domain-containing protein [Dyadobacter psychrotolerans]TDE17620.1 DUF2905 domain-containing protein [Dyadobacter psychrotolerans]
MSQSTGKYLIVIGLVILTFGISIYFMGDKLRWLGRLPGDIRIEKENLKFFFPITTMILLSALLNLIIYLFRKFLG